MTQEIERKFLMAPDFYIDSFKYRYTWSLIEQDYLLDKNNHTIRVRTNGDNGYMTYKAPSKGISRTEIEFRIPRFIARMLMGKKRIEKIRYLLKGEDGKLWEIDKFLGENYGLWLAEIELTYEDEPFIIPNIVGDEVSHDSRYYNSYLYKHPYKSW